MTVTTYQTRQEALESLLRTVRRLRGLRQELTDENLRILPVLAAMHGDCEAPMQEQPVLHPPLRDAAE